MTKPLCDHLPNQMKNKFFVHYNPNKIEKLTIDTSIDTIVYFITYVPSELGTKVSVSITYNSKNNLKPHTCPPSYEH